MKTQLTGALLDESLAQHNEIWYLLYMSLSDCTVACWKEAYQEVVPDFTGALRCLDIAHTHCDELNSYLIMPHTATTML